MNEFLVIYEKKLKVLLSLQGIQSSFKECELSRMLWGKKLDSFFPEEKRALPLALR